MQRSKEKVPLLFVPPRRGLTVYARVLIEKKKEWISASRIIKYYGEEIITYEDAVKLNDIYIEGMKEKVVSRPKALEVMKYLY